MFILQYEKHKYIQRHVQNSTLVYYMVPVYSNIITEYKLYMHTIQLTLCTTSVSQYESEYEIIRYHITMVTIVARFELRSATTVGNVFSLRKVPN